MNALRRLGRMIFRRSPNLFRAFSRGRPEIDIELFMPPEIDSFLRHIWSRFGHLTADQLTKLTKRSDAYQKSLKRGRRAEIPLELMRLSFTRDEAAPAADRIVKPKVMVTQSGRAVQVKNWIPGRKPEE
jgi:hypothetical protein